jgi:nicotinate phosphoribosyltransferase
MQGNKALLTDLYQLTMNAAYFDNKKDDVATFDLFIRKLPEDWGYFIANGIEDAVDYIENLRFEEDDIQYLRSQGLFKEEFLEFLKDFRFEGDVYAVKEGTPVFPNEPIVRVTAKRTQAQYVETALLNMINFQTMIASKANRVVNAAKEAKVVDFGLRRAQEEDAGMKGARAAYVAGAVATSNVKAGKEYGIPISGTHAHSFVMSFPNELDAFRAYVKTFPDKPTLLIDTYDTVQGARNAAVVAKELEERGKQLGSVRLDSGDLSDLAKKVRQIFEEEGLSYVKVLASNDLNEYKIDDLLRNGAPIDGFGVGTEMITAKPVAAIGGVYKLVEDDDGAKIKLSADKKTLPGKKQVYRQIGEDGLYNRDVVALDHENYSGIPLLELAVKDGKRAKAKPSLKEIRNFCLSEVAKLPLFLKELKVKEQFRMDISEGLNELVNRLTERYSKPFFSDQIVYKEHYKNNNGYQG